MELGDCKGYRMDETYDTHGEVNSSYKILVLKPEMEEAAKHDRVSLNTCAGDRPPEPWHRTEAVGCEVVQEVQGFLRREPVHGGL
jgi:hypothetical protein